MKQSKKFKALDFADPFQAGQMVGMLVMLTFIEKNGEMPEGMIQELKTVCADNAQLYLDAPTEDVFLMVDNVVKEIGTV